MKILLKKKTEDDTVALKLVMYKEALKISTILHNFLLQYDKSITGLLDAIRKIRDEVQ